MLKNYIELLQNIKKIEDDLGSYEEKINIAANLQNKLLVEVQLESELAQRKVLQNLSCDIEVTQNEIADTMKYLNAKITQDDNEYYVQFHNVRKRFLSLLGRWKILNSNWKESNRIKLERQIKSLDISLTDEEIKDCIQSSESIGDLQIFQELILRDKTARGILANVEERRHELQVIETKMNELMELFRDMENTVAIQEKQLDNIDITIEKTTVDIEKGLSNVGSAVTSSRRSYYNMKNISYVIICAVLILGMISAITVASFISKGK